MRLLRGLLLFVSLLLPYGSLQAVVVDRIALVVNDEVVTLSEIERLVHVEAKGHFYSAVEYMRREKLKERLEPFIEDLLLKQQARKMKVEVQDRDVQRVIEAIRRENLISHEQLLEHLKRQGITYEDFFEGIRTNLLRSRLLSQALSMTVAPSEETLRSYYEAHREEFREESLHLKQIFFSHTMEDARDLAERAIQELKAGKEFDEVATKFLRGTEADLGFLQVSELMPEIREALRGLKEGMYTGIVVSAYGLHIIKVEQIQKGEMRPFERVKEEIRQRLLKEESERRYREYMDKLKRNSYIEVKI